MNPATITVGPDGHAARLDRFLAQACPDHSRSALQRLIADGRVTVNGQLARSSHLLRDGDLIAIAWPPPASRELLPEQFALPILYQDDDLLVIAKPAGLTVHPGAGTQAGTLVNALLGYDYEHFSELVDEDRRPGIVHRLDKDTSGVLAIARHEQAKARLSAAFAAREVTKTYLALVAGQPRPPSQRLVTPYGRHPVHRRKMTVLRQGGKEAITRYRTWVAGPGAALLEVQLETGRTHQIRVHLAHLGCPILGDAVYGPRHAGAAPRQMLHAWRLAFAHPMTRQPMSFTAPLPDDFRAAALAHGIALPAEILDAP